MIPREKKLLVCSRHSPSPYPGKECIEAVHFLTLSDIGIVLSNSLQGQLLHQIYLIGFLQMGILKNKDIHKAGRSTCKTMYVSSHSTPHLTSSKARMHYLATHSSCYAENRVCKFSQLLIYPRWLSRPTRSTLHKQIHTDDVTNIQSGK